MSIKEIEEVYFNYGVKRESGKKSDDLFPPLQYEEPSAYRDINIITSDSCYGSKLERK